jgi:SAM-dependent methyltransferase
LAFCSTSLHNGVEMPDLKPLERWEQMWARYDAATYTAVLDHVTPQDVVLDIGAGDLYLARRLAARAHKVYAIEIQPALLAAGANCPPNLRPICADARREPFPRDVTTAVLLMRHCTHFALYWRKLKATNCRTLLTNARWGLGVEHIDLCAPRMPYASVTIGWYACACGGTGFIVGDPQQLKTAVAETIHEVYQCPDCAP